MFRTFSLNRFLLAVLLLTSLSLAVPANAQSGATIQPPSPLFSSAIPTQVFLTATVPISRLIYIWTAVSGATQYEYQINYYLDKLKL